MSFMLSTMSNVARSPGDPKVIHSGPSSFKPVDRLGRGLGWFSLGLGLTELLAPRMLTRWLGVEGMEGLVRAYGAREIASGIMCLSIENGAGAWSRVGGDMLDLASLAAAYRDDNPKKGNVGLALALVAGITVLDAVAGSSIRAAHDRKGEPVRDYSDRSGFPRGRAYSHGKAAQGAPQDYRATPAATGASRPTGETSPASADLILEVPA